jgi:hypothetical protein
MVLRFCFRAEEDINHLFFSITLSLQVWKKIHRWLNVDFIPFEQCWSHFNNFGALAKNKKYLKVLHLIWLVTTWSLWRAHNNIMFGAEAVDLSSLVDQIIFIFGL